MVLVASVITYVISSSQYRHANRISEANWFPFALCSALVLGAMLYCLYPSLLSDHDDLAVAAYLAGSILDKLRNGERYLETGRVFGSWVPSGALHGSAALLIGTFGALALSFFPRGTWGASRSCSCPFPWWHASGRAFGRCRPRAVRPGHAHRGSHSHEVPRHLVFQGLALGVMHSFLISDFGSSAVVVSMGYLVAVVLLFFCAVAVKNNFDALIYRIGFPLMASGFFVVGMLDDCAVRGSARP